MKEKFPTPETTGNVVINKVVYTTSKQIMGISGIQKLEKGEEIHFESEHDDAERLLNILLDWELILIDANNNGQRELILVTTSFNGRDVNGLLYLAAPSKFYGYDKADIKSDWRDLYNASSSTQAERLDRHSKFPGWEHYERDKEFIYEIIVGEPYKKEGILQAKHYAVPVIRFKVKDGSLDWSFKPLEKDVSSELFKSNRIVSLYQSRLYPSLGAVFAAALSPEIPKYFWEINEGYVDNGPHRTNNIGATQVWPYSIWKSKDLLRGRFVQAAANEMGLKVGVGQFKASNGEADTRE